MITTSLRAGGTALAALVLAIATAGCLGIGSPIPPNPDPNEPISTDPNDPAGDTDLDGLVNAREDELGTDPNDPDSDADELEDGPEVDDFGTDPLSADTDGDSLLDGEEVALGSDPLSADIPRTLLEIRCDTFLLVDDLPTAGREGVFEAESSNAVRSWRANDKLIRSADESALINLTRDQAAAATVLGERSTTSKVQNLAIDGSTVSLSDATLWFVESGDRETARAWQITDDVVVLRPQRSGDPQRLINVTRCTSILAEKL